MKKKLSMSEVLSRLVERVRRIESDAGQVAAVLDKMIERVEKHPATRCSKKKIS